MFLLCPTLTYFYIHIVIHSLCCFKHTFARTLGIMRVNSL